MRKIDPNGVREDFTAAVQSIAALTFLLEDVPPAARQAIELQLLSAVVLWEGFITDLFVAYVNRDSHRFTEDLRTRIIRSVRDKFGDVAAAKTVVTLPAHLDRLTVVGLLDPVGRNLSFASAQDLVATARRILPTAASNRFARLRPVDRASIDAWTAIRNFVAHRSRSAKNRMNKALVVPHLPGVLRRGPYYVRSVGRYLAARTGGASRAEFIFKSMRSIARRL